MEVQDIVRDLQQAANFDTKEKTLKTLRNSNSTTIRAAGVEKKQHSFLH